LSLRSKPPTSYLFHRDFPAPVKGGSARKPASPLIAWNRIENGPRQAKSHAGQNVIATTDSQKDKEMSTTTTNISAGQVKELRERSGAPMMDCKNALTECKGDLEQALVWLRKKGIATAAKKAARVTSEGSVASYIHAGGKIGVLVEINCESDFVARTDDFKDLIKDIAMHIAAADPKFIRKEDVTPEAYEKEKEIYRAQAASTGKPANVVEKIVEGKMSKFYEEVCLLDQPFVKEPGITIHQLIASKIGKLGENISVRRFARFKVGDAGETIAITKLQQEAKAE
jgi:elongation factor Ts